MYGESSLSTLIVVAEDDPACMILGNPVSSPEDALVDVAGLSALSAVILVEEIILEDPELEEDDDADDDRPDAEDVSFPEELEDDAFVEPPEEK